MKTIKARCISKGYAEGEALVTKERISFWGGTEPKTGEIIEKHHELEGQSFKDKVLVFQSTKGSSGTSLMLQLTKANNTAPLAFVNVEVDALAALGCIFCDFPMVGEPEEDVFQFVETGDWIKVDATNGLIEITKKHERT